MDNSSKLKQAKQLMDGFAALTGLTAGDASRRYLWTDAFAVQSFFGLSHALNSEEYQQRGLQLIDLVHQHLGKFHSKDSRKGWISGLTEDEAKTRPTIAGLRIGKDLPERKNDESYNSKLEWERDGQYFHYLSRWMITLLQAFNETKDKKYLFQAKDLFLATGKFLYGSGRGLAMYWKMDTKLSRPLVPSMGHHDPLEGLLCGMSIKNAIFEEDQNLDALINKFEIMCEGKSWTTPDPLGIGGLLLNTARAGELQAQGVHMPASVKVQKLYRESLDSLTGLYGFGKDTNPNRRLAFRECGLSLGLRVITASKNDIFETSSEEGFKQFYPLASEIETFWLDKEHRRASTWKDHLDINAVSLAASQIAHEAPEVFSGEKSA